jgi:hypothetical protein
VTETRTVNQLPPPPLLLLLLLLLLLVVVVVVVVVVYISHSNPQHLPLKARLAPHSLRLHCSLRGARVLPGLMPPKKDSGDSPKKVSLLPRPQPPPSSQFPTTTPPPSGSTGKERKGRR